MAHFAKIGLNGKVLQVLTLDNDKILNANGVEDEKVGQEYLQQHNNWTAEMWIQTSYNTKNNTHSSGDNSKAFRGNYAGIGYTWDEDNKIFWSKKPYPSWVKDLNTASWKSPIGDEPNLTAEQISQNEAGTHYWSYSWNEDGQSWDVTNLIA
tara:strand:- start:822 stop:1277 length:456 start_codon:yes stop_codon:yes gene_type:complete